MYSFPLQNLCLVIMFQYNFFGGYRNQTKGISIWLWSLMRPVLSFSKTETGSLSDASSLGIVTLCGVRFHVRDFLDTKASLVYLQSFLKCLSTRTDRELTLISTVSLFTLPSTTTQLSTPPPPPPTLVKLHNFEVNCILGFIHWCFWRTSSENGRASRLLSSFMAHN